MKKTLPQKSGLLGALSVLSYTAAMDGAHTGRFLKQSQENIKEVLCNAIDFHY